LFVLRRETIFFTIETYELRDLAYVFFFTKINDIHSFKLIKYIGLIQI